MGDKMIGIILILIGLFITSILINILCIYLTYGAIGNKDYIIALIPIVILMVYNGLILFALGI